MRKLTLSLLSLCVFAVGLAAAGEFGVPLAAKPPVIDGKIDPAEWGGALAISGASRQQGEKFIDPRRTQVYMLWDKTHVYVAMRTEAPPRGAPHMGNAGRGPMEDDSIELVFAPPEEGRGPGPYALGQFHAIINFRGDAQLRHLNPGFGYSTMEWKPGMAVANTIRDGFWELEIAIPAAAFGFSELKPGDWKILPVCNFRVNPWSQSPFTAQDGFMNFNSFSDFKLRESAVAVQNEWSDAMPRLPGKFTLRGADRATLTARIGGTEIAETLTKGKPVDLAKHFPAETVDAKVSVRGPGGDEIFGRHFRYAAPPDRIWFNPESCLVLEHDFSAGIDAPEVRPEGVKATVEGGPTLVAGEREGEKAIHFDDKGARIFYNGMKTPIPGAVAMTVKVDEYDPNDRAKSPTSWFFTSNFRGGNLTLSASRGSPHLTVGFFNDNDKDKNRKIWVRGRPFFDKDKWAQLVVNLHPGRAELFLDGELAGEFEFAEPLDPALFSAFRMGGGNSGFRAQRVAVYERALTPGEIKLMAQGEAKIGGTISWYAVINALALDLDYAPEKLNASALELRIANADGENVFTAAVDLTQNVYVDGAQRILRRKVELGKTLPDGAYKASLRAAGEEAALLEKEFIVRNYEWLNNDLGTREILLPPFTPLVVDGQTVSCILRDYRLGGNGLLSQVTALGESILAGPVQLLVEKDGRTHAQPEGTLTFTQQKETFVEYTAESAGPALALKVAGRMEQDGFLKLDLFLNATGGVPDRVYLDIPVKKEFAPLFHAAGEGIRANPGGFIPAGGGTVWRSRSLPQTSTSNFVPYVWVGEDERGIAYAADWDRGWVHTEERDAVEVVRAPSGDVAIRLNLLNAPKALKKDHQITIALMATPVKPMPKGWRGWTDAFSLKGARITRALVSNFHWGSYYGHPAQYPAFMDFGIIRKLIETSRTGVIDQAFVDARIQRVNDAPAEDVPMLKRTYRKDDPNWVRNHTNRGFSLMRELHPVREKATVYYYTCNYEAADWLPEFPVFQDEWAGRVHLQKSYADYALYYFNKMLDAGMDGIYNDNTFRAAIRQWPTGNGYVDDDGEIRPSFGLWRAREYYKRLLTLMVERGMDPWIHVHHTNSNVLPSLGFATNAMGMEWKYGDTDFQERWSPDYIRAVNQGLQGGFFPTSLEGIRFSDGDRAKINAKDPAALARQTEVTRTMLAVLLPHEVQPTMPGFSDRDLVRAIREMMLDFGVAEDDCSYHAYWNKDVPVKSSDPDVLVSVYTRGNRMMLVCGSYAGDVQLALTANAPVRRAVNHETGEALSVSGNVVKLPLKKHDFALLLLEM